MHEYMMNIVQIVNYIYLIFKKNSLMCFNILSIINFNLPISKTKINENVRGRELEKLICIYIEIRVHFFIITFFIAFLSFMMLIIKINNPKKK